ncbi:hypothetical protein [Streptomyces sp. NPDC002790]|uniref:hypothetical protein n=1 Tax=Streptomyces sp. NPDC002790 TaxID=3154431 RepID=UPI00331DA5EB
MRRPGTGCALPKGWFTRTVPSNVIDARVRVEPWKGNPPGEGPWSHDEEAEVVFPAGELCVYTLGETLPTEIALATMVAWEFENDLGPAADLRHRAFMLSRPISP